MPSPQAIAFKFLDGELNGPATPEALSALREAVPALPADFFEFLARHNGGEGSVAQTYLVLERAEELLALQRDARVAELAPGFFLIGSNGSGESFAFDLRAVTPHVVMVPAILEREAAIKQADTFSEFLLGISDGALPTFE